MSGSVVGKQLRFHVEGGLNNFVSARRVRNCGLLYEYDLAH